MLTPIFSGDSRLHRSPMLTVAMPVYNAGKYLRLAVLSIIQQSFNDWEMIIIDDGSTDDAIASISDLIDSRIHVLRDGLNKGLASRLNETIDLAKGKYIARMDQDDISYPDRFRRQIDFLEANPRVDVVAVGAVRISENGDFLDRYPLVTSHDEICARPWVGFYFPHPTWLGRSEWFRAYKYKIPAPYFCEDQELLLRSYIHSNFACLPEVLFAYRIRDKVNPEKLYGTRRGVLKAQISNFCHDCRLLYIPLSLLVFAMRVVSDKYFKWFGQIHKERGAVLQDEKDRLNRLYDQLSSRN